MVGNANKIRGTLYNPNSKLFKVLKWLCKLIIPYVWVSAGEGKGQMRGGGEISRRSHHINTITYTLASDVRMQTHKGWQLCDGVTRHMLVFCHVYYLL